MKIPDFFEELNIIEQMQNKCTDECFNKDTTSNFIYSEDCHTKNE